MFFNCHLLNIFLSLLKTIEFIPSSYHTMNFSLLEETLRIEHLAKKTILAAGYEKSAYGFANIKN
jgi:hypothetical protein